MSECCEPGGYDREFDADFAKRMAARYRRSGLTRSARRLVDFLAGEGIRGATVLEIGGGVGEIGLELLRRGAASATTLELSSAYDAEAARLAAEAGMTSRMQRRIADIAADPKCVEPADLVVLHRVVCCCPDYERLLTAAADRCRRRLAFSHPRRDPLTLSFAAMGNAMFRMRGSSYRAYMHSPAAMVGALEAQGMRAVLPGRGWLWQVQGLRAA